MDFRPILFILILSGALLTPATLTAQETADEQPIGWPRDFVADEGFKVTIYQPQPDSLRGPMLSGRAAASVLPKGRTEPVFGAFWYEAKLDVDRDARIAQVTSVEIPRLRFPGASEADLDRLRNALESETSGWDLSINLDELTAALAALEETTGDGAEYGTDPPKILYTTQPSILVLLDGEPVLRNIEGSSIQRVVNTPFLMGYDPAAKVYFVNIGREQDWFETGEVKRTWSPTSRPPADLITLYRQQEREAEPDTVTAEGPAPALVVATEPTELIVSNGEPQYAPIVGDELLYMTTTETPVFKEIASQDFFVVFSGRWYRSKSMLGPWTFLPSTELPESFKSIPEDSPRGDVLAYVAGTVQAEEAVMDAHVPQTAAINRKDTTITVTYDGDPAFEAIPGTSMEYAVNTGTQVLRIDGKYYACDQAVWFVADSPQGPWVVADSVPQEEIQKIPPESPVYNTKYVYIYDTTPSVVYVGYMPGYVGCYPYHGTVIYGTGYVYRPWVGPYYYYPRPVTYGFHVHYNPYYGWSFGMSMSFGWGGGYYHRPPYYRPPYYGGGWYGPARPPYRPPYRPGTPGYRPPPPPGAGGRPVPTPYGRTTANNIYNRDTNRNRVARPDPGASPATRPARTPTARPSTQPSTRPNDVFTDRNGNVYRKANDGSWQTREGNSWKSSPSTRPAPERPGQPSTRPSTQQSRPSQQPGSAPPRLDRDHEARQRGNSRATNYNRTGGSRPPSGGGAARPAPRSDGGGGGRRR